MIQRLIIDDLREPIDPRPGDVVCKTLGEALALLDSGQLDAGVGELSLDHDLGVDGDGNEIEIKPFVRAMYDLCDPDGPNPVPVGMVTIHSSNGPGVEWLKGMFTMGPMAAYYPNVRVVDSNDVGLFYPGTES